MKQTAPTPPVAAKKPHTITVHNDPREDPYYWLRDRENPEVIAYLEAENAYTKASLAHTESFQKQLFEEIKGRIKEDDESVPYLDNDYYYLTRFVKGGEYPIYVRKHKSLDNQDEVLLDVNKLAEGHDYYQVGSRSVSLDNKTMAYGVDTVSRRLYTLHFKNLEKGDHFEETIPNTSGSVIWANDNQHLFYVRKHPETLRSYQVVRHRLGTDPTEDVIVFTEEDDTYNVGIFKTKSDKWLVIGSFQTISQEFRILPADAPLDEWRIFQPRERNL
jgi:oligopeptidase B